MVSIEHGQAVFFIPFKRYRFQMDSIEQLVMDTVTEQMTKRQHLEVTSKQLLRLLTSVSGYCAARLMVVNKLDSWLQNPKVGNHTLSLYIYIYTGVCTV